MTSLVVIGTALCASIAVTSFSNYNRKTYKEICEEEYPVLFEEQFSDKLSAVSIKNIEDKFVVFDEKQNVIFEIVRNPIKEYSWLINNNETNLWEIQVSKNNISFLGSKAKVSYAFKKQEGCNKTISIQYCYGSLQYNSFSLFDTKKLIDEPYTKNDTEYRWLFKSKYLEKIIMTKNNSSLKRIAFAINNGKNNQNNSYYDYQIIYNKNEIDQESLVITLFLSTMTQWKHHDTCSEILKQRLIKWNEIRSNHYKDQEQKKIQENIENNNSSYISDERSYVSSENKQNFVNTNTKNNKSILSDAYSLQQKTILGKDPAAIAKEPDISSEIDIVNPQIIIGGEAEFLEAEEIIKRKTSFRRKLVVKTWNMLQKK